MRQGRVRGSDGWPFGQLVGQGSIGAPLGTFILKIAELDGTSDHEIVDLGFA